MIKFIHKKHMHKSHSAKLVIYYSMSDIFLGSALVLLVIFFIHDYLSHSLEPSASIARIYQNASYSDTLPAR